MNGKLYALGKIFNDKRMSDYRLDYISFIEGPSYHIAMIYLVDGEGRYSYQEKNGHRLCFYWRSSEW